MTRGTVKPTQRSTVRETVTLETKCERCDAVLVHNQHADGTCGECHDVIAKSNILPFPPAKCQAREWLMRDICSTPYAVICS